MQTGPFDPIEPIAYINKNWTFDFSLFRLIEFVKLDEFILNLELHI